MRKPNSSKGGTVITVKKEVIEIESDSDTDEVGGRILALCGGVDASCKPLNASAERDETSMQIVCADDLEYDPDYKKYFASCWVKQPYLLEGNTSPMRLTHNAANEATGRSKSGAVKVEKIRAGSPLVSSVAKKLKSKNGEADYKLISRSVFKKRDARQGRKTGLTKNTIRLEKPTSNVKETRQGRKAALTKNTIRLEKPKSNAKDTRQKKEDARTGRKVGLTKTTIKLEEPTKKVKDTKQKKEDGRRGRKIGLTKNTIKLEKPAKKVKDTKQKKEDGRRGRKTGLTKNTIKLEKPTKKVKDTQEKKEDGRRGRKRSVTKNIFKACKLENEESSARRNAKSQTMLRASKRLKIEKTIPMVNTKETRRKKEDARQGMKRSVTKNNFKASKKEKEEGIARRKENSQTTFRASKRLKTENGRVDHNLTSKTIPVVNAKETKRKEGEAPQEKKIPMTKNNVKSKSTSHVKDNLPNSFKAHKKENEESRSSLDKSYGYFLACLRNSMVIFEPDRKAKPEKELVSLSDPDIIAVSNYPFSDGGNSPFQANKDGKVIDLEDGTEPEIVFNSSFSKKLLEVLRKPFDKDEFLQRCHEASVKKQLTRSRQLRDGREIEYNVDNQSTPSYLDQYPDFYKKFRLCRYGKDDPRALNLLRGFFFYFENIVLDGAFKPWLYEKRVKRECEDIECIEEGRTAQALLGTS
ncbi:unnamed protein product [Thlaspi arvense]|uniref:Uncharacterized protein n=1 Tax=Thlaspi arvense TaxID=13288 RepID=A0AAU9SJH5_THLAR|nr:unnamed protein product [Thlaspi arvense]